MPYKCHRCGEWAMTPDAGETRQSVNIGHGISLPVGRSIYDLQDSLTCEECGCVYRPSEDTTGERERNIEMFELLHAWDHYRECEAAGFPHCGTCTVWGCPGKEKKGRCSVNSTTQLLPSAIGCLRAAYWAGFGFGRF